MKTLKRLLAALLIAAVLSPGVSLAASGKGGSSKSGTVHVKGYTKKDGTHVKAHERKAAKEKGTKAESDSAATTPTPGGARDERSRIQRSETAKRAFMQQTGYPHGRPGYVIDHIKPLACGGADDP